MIPCHRQGLFNLYDVPGGSACETIALRRLSQSPRGILLHYLGDLRVDSKKLIISLGERHVAVGGQTIPKAMF